MERNGVSCDDRGNNQLGPLVEGPWTRSSLSLNEGYRRDLCSTKEVLLGVLIEVISHYLIMTIEENSEGGHRKHAPKHMR